MMFNSRALAATAGLLLAAAAAQAAPPPPPAPGATHKGMTWRTYGNNVPGGAVVGCKNQCNAYQGDTLPSERLPVLCIVPGTSPEPAGYAAAVGGPTAAGAASSNWRFYYGWSGGQIGLSRPTLGADLTSRTVGDNICKRDLKDPNARMAEHHDNKVGGWGLGGMIHPNSNAKGLLTNGGTSDSKFWTAIKNQPANPWN
ncbi:MAG: hypothetical protein ACKOPO_14760 [Novosphingobium sp.]